MRSQWNTTIPSKPISKFSFHEDCPSPRGNLFTKACPTKMYIFSPICFLRTFMETMHPGIPRLRQYHATLAVAFFWYQSTGKDCNCIYMCCLHHQVFPFLQ